MATYCEGGPPNEQFRSMKCRQILSIFNPFLVSLVKINHLSVLGGGKNSCTSIICEHYIPDPTVHEMGHTLGRLFQKAQQQNFGAVSCTKSAVQNQMATRSTADFAFQIHADLAFWRLVGGSNFSVILFTLPFSKSMKIVNLEIRWGMMFF